MPSARLIQSLFGATTALVAGLLAANPAAGQSAAASRFGRTDNRAQYVHRIELLDADKKKIDPADPKAGPYSPVTTCGKCHDYKAISHGWHFNAFQGGADAGRVSEPWLWVDKRIGTQIPLSGRGWPGTYAPSDLGLKPHRFTRIFGRHFPGGGAGEAAATEPDNPRWKASGELAVDCMACHAAGRQWSHSVWMEQLADENFAWAPTAALGLGKVEGAVKALPRDFDPATPPEGQSLPSVKYYSHLFDADKNVFFDVVRQPTNNACNQCHTHNAVGPSAPPEWNTDQDVHMKAGLACADCHRNDIGHATMRGFLGEKNPTQPSVTTLSCKGCHYGEDAAGDARHALGGRLGAPDPIHRGIPTLHFQKLSCTACHAGPAPSGAAELMQSSKAHELGVKSQTRQPEDAPGILAPVFLPGHDGKVTPHRVVWPAFWGWMKDGKITPIDPEAAYAALRSTLRVRSDFQRELGTARLTADEKAAAIGKDNASTPESKLSDEQRATLAKASAQKAAGEFRRNLLPKALAELAKGDAGSTPVYVSAGRAWKLAADGKTAEAFDHPAAGHYAWPIGHDVRPARQALGVKGCVECHTPDSPIFYSTASAVGPAPDDQPPQLTLVKSAGLDTGLLAAWEQSFQGHKTFKIIASASFVVVAGVLLMYGLQGLAGLSRMVFNRRT